MPAREQIGIDVSLTENVSQAAGSAGRSVEELRDRIAALNEELNPQKASEYFNSLNQQAQERQQRREQERQLSNVMQFPNAARRVGGQFANVGSGGDAVDAGADIAGTAGGLLRGIGGVAATTIGGAALVGGGLAATVSMAAKPWERVMEDMMDFSMNLGMFGETVTDQSVIFTEAMTMASDAGAKLGYRLEETVGVMTDLAKGGARGGAEDIRDLAGYTMEHARGFGMDPGELSGFVGTASRFGQQNPLEMIGGMLQQQNMMPARAGELVNAQLGLFEDALSRGVVRGFDEIGALQNMFASGGEVFKGERGSQIIRQMDASVAGATALGREEDVFIYRAARDLMERRKEEAESRGETFDYNHTDVMQLMERGLSTDLMQQIYQNAMAETGGAETDMIEKFRGQFRLSYTNAERVLDLIERGDYDDAVQLAEPRDLSETDEVRMLRFQEQISNDVRLISKTFLRSKTDMAEEFAGLTNFLTTHVFDVRMSMGGDEPESDGTIEGNLAAAGMEASEEQIAAWREGRRANAEMLTRSHRDVEVPEVYTPFNPSNDLWGVRDESQVPGEWDSRLYGRMVWSNEGRDVRRALTNLTPEERIRLYTDSSVTDVIADARSGSSPRGGIISNDEMTAILRAMQTSIETIRDQPINIIIEREG